MASQQGSRRSPRRALKKKQLHCTFLASRAEPPRLIHQVREREPGDPNRASHDFRDSGLSPLRLVAAPSPRRCPGLLPDGRGCLLTCAPCPPSLFFSLSSFPVAALVSAMRLLLPLAPRSPLLASRCCLCSPEAKTSRCHYHWYSNHLHVISTSTCTAIPSLSLPVSLRRRL